MIIFLAWYSNCYIGSRGRLIKNCAELSESFNEMVDRHIPKSFTSGDACEWFKRFEICSKANGWSDATKALKLPTLLEGEALAIWLELSEEEQSDYKSAKEKLTSKMMPMVFVSLDEFHRRKLQPREALSVFVHDMKKLLEQAMPNLDAWSRPRTAVITPVSSRVARRSKSAIEGNRRSQESGCDHRASPTPDDLRRSRPSRSCCGQAQRGGRAQGADRKVDRASCYAVCVVTPHSG